MMSSKMDVSMTEEGSLVGMQKPMFGKYIRYVTKNYLYQ